MAARSKAIKGTVVTTSEPPTVSARLPPSSQEIVDQIHYNGPNGINQTDQTAPVVNLHHPAREDAALPTATQRPNLLIQTNITVSSPNESLASFPFNFEVYNHT